MAQTEAAQSSRFFKLPAEMRNEIYRLVLLAPEGKDVPVTKAGYERPALLATCKEIRSEALKIYYVENKFEVRVPNFDSTTYSTFLSTLEKLELDKETFTAPLLTHGDVAIWDNLLVWLRKVHSGELPNSMGSAQRAKEQNSDLDAQYYLVYAMFNMADSLKRMPWDVVEKLLLDYKDVFPEENWEMEDA